jgi:hypothetical protein
LRYQHPDRAFFSKGNKKNITGTKDYRIIRIEKYGIKNFEHKDMTKLLSQFHISGAKKAFNMALRKSATIDKCID